MKGLLKKDILLATKTYKFILIVCIVLFAVRFFAEEVSVAVLLPVMFAGMLPTSLLAVDERDGWDRTAEMLPVTRAQRVGAKFLLGFLFWAVMAARALAMEVAGSMANTSYLLAMPTAEEEATPRALVTEVRYRKESRTIHSWREMGIPTRASSPAFLRSIRKFSGRNWKMKFFRFKYTMALTMLNPWEAMVARAVPRTPMWAYRTSTMSPIMFRNPATATNSRGLLESP